MKTCALCDRPAQGLGLCKPHYDRQRYLANRERLLAQQREWAANNRGRVNAASKRYSDANRGKTRAAVRAWEQNNQERKRERVRARRERLRLATPPWVAARDLQPFYDEARRLTAETGIRHEVDHIVPIDGEKVCGLHVPWNMRVITAAENLRKGRRLLE